MLYNPDTQKWNLKEVAIFAKATKIIKDDVSYTVPSSWVDEEEVPENGTGTAGDRF